MTSNEQVYPADYADGRGRFLGLAGHAGFSVDSFVHPLHSGPAGEPLACDIAFRGSADARDLVMVVSGTHGVEGFLGSGCQAALLQSAVIDTLPASSALLLVHAVNPYGFAWLRRTNEDNIDLNRNFVDHGREYPNPGYEEIHDWLVPAEWEGPVREAADAAIAHYIEERGPRAFQAALTGGQYTHPDGLFYGGRAPAWSNRIWRGILRRYCQRAERVVVIDLHSGLGPRGVGEAICVSDEDEYRRARALFGDDVTWTGNAGAVSSRVGGSLVHGAREELGGDRLTMIGLEYGTYPIPQTLEALRAETWISARGDPCSAHGRRLRQALRDAFYIDELDWQQAVLARFFSLMGRLVSQLN